MDFNINQTTINTKDKIIFSVSLLFSLALHSLLLSQYGMKQNNVRSFEYQQKTTTKLSIRVKAQNQEFNNEQKINKEAIDIESKPPIEAVKPAVKVNKKNQEQKYRNKNLVNQKFNLSKNFNENEKKSVVSINENTIDYKYAQYFEDWKNKVEKVGAMNYPMSIEKANLKIAVTILSNGEVAHIKILKSSGYKEVDEAAIKTLQQSSPFAKFPPNLTDETDKIEIVKTWSYDKKTPQL